MSWWSPSRAESRRRVARWAPISARAARDDGRQVRAGLGRRGRVGCRRGIRRRPAGTRRSLGRGAVRGFAGLAASAGLAGAAGAAPSGGAAGASGASAVWFASAACAARCRSSSDMPLFDSPAKTRGLRALAMVDSRADPRWDQPARRGYPATPCCTGAPSTSTWVATAGFGTVYSALRRGAIAQLGERLNGIQKVGGSNPPSSTTPRHETGPRIAPRAVRFQGADDQIRCQRSQGPCRRRHRQGSGQQAGWGAATSRSTSPSVSLSTIGRRLGLHSWLRPHRWRMADWLSVTVGPEVPDRHPTMVLSERPSE